MGDDFFNRFDNSQHGYDFDSDPFFQNAKKRHSDFDDSFATAQKVFFIFFGIVATFVGCAFIFAIFHICFRMCKGESFQDYRRQRRFDTVIPPPPPLNDTSNYLKHMIFLVFFAVHFFRFE